jgi:hypothetical protein
MTIAQIFSGNLCSPNSDVKLFLLLCHDRPLARRSRRSESFNCHRSTLLLSNVIRTDEVRKRTTFALKSETRNGRQRNGITHPSLPVNLISKRNENDKQIDCFISDHIPLLVDQSTKQERERERERFEWKYRTKEAK